MKKLLSVLILTCALVLGLSAELSLPTVLTDHMVLQRSQKVPVWGTAAPGSAITVAFNGQQKATTADAEGRWRVDLDSMPANAKPQSMTITSSKDENIEISDILIGDVWLAGGQSNMEWGVNRSKDRHATIAASIKPLIRLYRTPKVYSLTPKDKVDAAWTPCNRQTSPLFSAVAYHFGKKLQEELGVPIGLLQSCWGGSKIEPWIPSCGFEGFDSLADFQKMIENFPVDLEPDREKPRNEKQNPTAMYNAMIHPHIPFAIKGAIWYQGESNRGDGMLYIDKTKALLKGWYQKWGYEFPFYFVQIAPYQYGKEDPSIVPELWEAQAEIVRQIPNTGMAVVSDATTLDDIHPPNKVVPGTRLALLALDHTYGKDLVSAGPTFKDMTIQEGQIKVVFDSAKGLTTRDGKAPDWFEIAGEDGVWKPAEAVIKGQGVILRSPEVDKPAAMRFAWHKLATPNLMNAAGLPAVPFRAPRP